MKLWIARGVGKDGRLTLHYERPIYTAGEGWDKIWAIPDNSLFSEVTFENSPQEVELTLCNHIDTVNIQDHNPKKQACVLTNHGIDTDVIFK